MPTPSLKALFTTPDGAELPPPQPASAAIANTAATIHNRTRRQDFTERLSFSCNLGACRTPAADAKSRHPTRDRGPLAIDFSRLYSSYPFNLDLVGCCERLMNQVLVQVKPDCLELRQDRPYFIEQAFLFAQEQ